MYTTDVLLQVFVCIKNFVANIIWRGGKRNAAKFISTSHEYMVFYAKDLEYFNKTGKNWKIRKLIREEDKKTKAMGGVIYWNYLLNHVDSEF